MSFQFKIIYSAESATAITNIDTTTKNILSAERAAKSLNSDAKLRGKGMNQKQYIVFWVRSKQALFCIFD